MLYAGMGQSDLSVMAGLSADELQPAQGIYNRALMPYYLNDLSQWGAGGEFWTMFYRYINLADSVIALADTATGLNPAVKSQVLGEAHFVRAFSFYYLVSLYGDCPLALGTDSEENRQLARAPAVQVWDQVRADADAAEAELSGNYLDSTLVQSTIERTRPTKWAAAALLARTFLATGRWDSAEYQATLVIDNPGLYALPPLNAVFLKNSAEAIWQLPPPAGEQNSIDAEWFLPAAAGKPGQVVCTRMLIDSFEAGDQRRRVWLDSVDSGRTTYYYPYKYKAGPPAGITTEYQMVLRLGELYLIRAEARAQRGNMVGALADLNILRARAGLPAYGGPTDQASVLAAIGHEVKVECFTEWGARWLNLKRTGIIEAVMAHIDPIKGSVWSMIEALYPLPIAALQADGRLAQNPGY
jgi:hypothetical protein